MLLPNSIPLGIHDPALLPKSVLLAELTARDKMIHELLSIVAASASSRVCQHAVIIGASGLGKTTVLHVLKHRIQDDSKLSKTWVPLLFDEENHHIGDVAGFWLECLRLLEAAMGRKGKVSHGTLCTSRGAALENQAREAFLDLLRQTKRRALLLVDHLDEVLAVAKDEKAQRRLRTFLKEETAVRVIGTASAIFPDVSQKGRPYHNLFRLIPLEGFTLEEMKAAMHAMADARAETSKHIHRPAREGYWRGLHILTGGNPRLLKMTYHLLERRVGSDFQAQLQGLLDASTPDFKQRIGAMSRQQRRVFDAIAHAWNAVQIADISGSLRMESNQISAQIQALVDAQLIAITGGSVKRKLYRVADRFTNACHFMRFSHSGRSRFEWFIRTMNILLAPDPNAESEERLRELAGPRAADSDRKLHTLLLAHAMRGIDADWLRLGENDKGVRHLLRAEQGDSSRELPGIATTMELFEMEYDLVRHVANTSAEQRSKLGYQHTSPLWWCVVACEADKLQKTAFVEQCARKAVDLAPSNMVAWGILSVVLLQRGRSHAALDAAQKILRLTKAELPCKVATAVTLAAKHPMPDQRADAEKIALEMAMQSPGELLSILGFWRYLRTDVEACKQLLPSLFKTLASTSPAAEDHTHFLALGLSATLLAVGLDDQLQEAINAAGVQEALDTPLQVIHLRKDDSLRTILAPERLALAEAYMAEIEKRQTEMRRAGARGNE